MKRGTKRFSSFFGAGCAWGGDTSLSRGLVLAGTSSTRATWVASCFPLARRAATAFGSRVFFAMVVSENQLQVYQYSCVLARMSIHSRGLGGIRPPSLLLGGVTYP